MSLLVEHSELRLLPVKCSSVLQHTAARSEPAPRIFPLLMAKRSRVMADVLGEGPQQCSMVQECMRPLAARQEPWEPLPDVREHWLCLLRASNQFRLPGAADLAALISEHFLGMTEELGGDAAKGPYPPDKAGATHVYRLTVRGRPEAPALSLLGSSKLGRCNASIFVAKFWVYTPLRVFMGG